VYGVFDRVLRCIGRWWVSDFCPQVTTQRPVATNVAQPAPAKCPSSFYFLRYVSGARCIPKRITYTAGAFSMI